MKTKEKILKMNKGELKKERDNIILDKDSNSCYYCNYCYSCDSCDYCNSCNCLVNGLFCKSLKFNERDYNKYWIYNIEVTKEEFEKKKEELGLK